MTVVSVVTTPATAPDAVAQAAASELRRRTGVDAHDCAVVLGSGWDVAAEQLGRLVAEVAVTDLAGFAPQTAPGHRGLVRSYDLAGVRVLAYLGRTHLFEGFGVAAVAHPVRVAAAAGARTVVLTNASGSLRRDWRPGTGVVLRDHLNWTGTSPLAGAAFTGFTDLTDAWSPRLRAAARDRDPALVEGVYAGMRGPSVQTGAETRMLRRLGADVVGMSTVVEAIAARARGLEVCGLSAVTTLEDSGAALDPDDVVAVADATARRLAPVLADVLRYAHTGSVS